MTFNSINKLSNSFSLLRRVPLVSVSHSRNRREAAPNGNKIELQNSENVCVVNDLYQLIFQKFQWIENMCWEHMNTNQNLLKRYRFSVEKYCFNCTKAQRNTKISKETNFSIRFYVSFTAKIVLCFRTTLWFLQNIMG